jgi:hypothetical protein
MPDRVVRPWNWPNGDEASTLGYRFPFDGNRPRTDSWDYGGIDIPSDPVSLRDAYEKAMYGEVVGIFETPPQPGDRPGKPQGGEIYDGCYATAIVDIVRLGDPAVAYDGFAYSMALQSIRRDGFKAVAGAPEFVAAESVWRDCMVARGFTPELLIFDRFETSSTAGPGEPNIDQIPLAIADWECKLAAQIPEIGERLFIDGTDAALRADPTLAEELHRYSTEIVAISQAMFSTSETAESGG